MTIKQREDYRKAAREIMPDITAIEWRYCWFACIPVWGIPDKVAQLRREEGLTVRQVSRAAELVYVKGVPKLRAQKAKHTSRADELIYVNGVPKLRARAARKGPRIRRTPKWLLPIK